MTVPYEFEPKDLDRPRGERSTEPPPDALAAAFRRWRVADESTPRPELGAAVTAGLYDRAVEELAGVDVRAPDATASLLSLGSNLSPTAGVFLSAAYNRAAEDVAFFDVELPAPIENLGYRLPEGKTLVLDGSVASAPATDAEGLVINRTDVGSAFGYSPAGAFVNAPGGTCTAFGTGSAGVAVDLRAYRASRSESPSPNDDDPVVSLASRDGVPSRELRAADLSGYPAVADYLDRLTEGLAGDRTEMEAFLNRMEPNPRVAIERELRERFERDRP